MLVSLILAVALASAATPSPEVTPDPDQSGAGLREIGHVYSSGECTAIATRANSAISSAIRNDQTVTIIVQTLRSVDLDSSNRITKINGLRELEQYATDLRTSAENAKKQAVELRKIAKESSDPVRKAELKTFADALSGAIERQRHIGGEMQGMLARIAGRDSTADVYRTVEHRQDQSAPWSPADAEFQRPVYNKMATDEAKWLELQVPLISGDESKAADHVVGAVNGC
ncbi:MAG TPA: hypothetical protein VMD07_00840 [Candidatus Acidoferrales bacterium]|nr:hypothetical protein [Candidatus Acidoferrales bacterium]